MYLRFSPPRRFTKLSRKDPTTTKSAPAGLLGGTGSCAMALKSASNSARASSALSLLCGDEGGSSCVEKTQHSVSGPRERSIHSAA